MRISDLLESARDIVDSGAGLGRGVRDAIDGFNGEANPPVLDDTNAATVVPEDTAKPPMGGAYLEQFKSPAAIISMVALAIVGFLAFRK